MNKIFQPISGKLIQEWLPNATIIKYGELQKYKELPSLPLVVLYEMKFQFGHWVTILRTKEGIEFFDSYGRVIDDELKFVPEYFKMVSGQNYKYLLKMLYDTGENIVYNNYKLQKGLQVATCGRWVILRNLFNDLTIDQFARMIFKTAKQLKISPDELVTMII